MSTYSPTEIVEQLTAVGYKKAKLGRNDLLIRSFLSGLLLAISTVLAATISSQTGLPFLGALAFPVGFVIIMLLGLELLSGNFATIPMALMEQRITRKQMFNNWGWVLLGNLCGSLCFAVLFAIYVSKFGRTYDLPIINAIRAVGVAKTITYQDMGASGLLILSIKALLCNWMVTVGVVMAFTTQSTAGKIIAIWLPIFTFFALGLEHCVVNMFVIPAAIFLDAPINLYQWIFWNQAPAILGNLIGGFYLTGFLLQKTYGRAASIAQTAAPAVAPPSSALEPL